VVEGSRGQRSRTVTTTLRFMIDGEDLEQDQGITLGAWRAESRNVVFDDLYLG